MTKNEFLTELEIALEAEAGSLTGDEILSDLEGWDSLAVMVFIAMVSEKFDVTLSASSIANSKSIADLIALLGDEISG
jgi:acyl carrier protein